MSPHLSKRLVNSWDPAQKVKARIFSAHLKLLVVGADGEVHLLLRVMICLGNKEKGLSKPFYQAESSLPVLRKGLPPSPRLWWTGGKTLLRIEDRAVERSEMVKLTLCAD
jgi:hypothetical protein